jgi:pimeloyl-ACP methyl ester carboxylesterase
MPTVRANEIDIYYEASGAGDPLVLIAGFGCDLAIWSLVAPALAAHYRVYVFDNRAIGRSTGAGAVASIAQMAADTDGLLEALEPGPVHVAGHSMGGMIALELAAAHPNRVRSLSLLSSFPCLDERTRAIIESWGDLAGWLDAEKCSRLILPWIHTSRFYAQPGQIDGLIALILANPTPPSAQTLFAQSRAISGFDGTDRLAAIGCPTLVMAGNEDALIPPGSLQQLASGIKQAELVLLEETGHGLLVETPEPVAAGLLSFLRGKTADGVRR